MRGQQQTQGPPILHRKPNADIHVEEVGQETQLFEGDIRYWVQDKNSHNR